jgi:hypothetical protein
MSEWREERLIRLIEELLAETRHIRKVLDKESEEPATGGKISQIEGDSIMVAITGIKAGGSGVFLVTWNGAMDPTKPTVWTSTDTGITFAPVPTDPTGNSVTVNDAVLDTSTTFDLTATGTNSAGAAVTATATGIPISLAPATGGTISQLS